MRYIKDNSNDKYEDVLDFANMVFSMEYTGIDFSVYLPKAYSRKKEGIVTHHMLVEEDSGKIRALIDTYPVRLRGADSEINAVYVGTVAVHPSFRNMGLFSELMEKVKEEAQAQKTDLMIVDGNRQRYANFGYEKAGMKYNFQIEYKSALAKAADKPPFSFEEVDMDDTVIDSVIDRLYRLYSARNITARDREDFYISLIGMKALLYEVIDNGNVIGYASLSENEKWVYEFELEDMSEIPRLMRDLYEGFGVADINVTVGADELEKLKYLESISSYYDVSASHQIRILNYEKVIAFLLKWKRRYVKLAAGEYTFGIKTGKNTLNYKITVNKSDIIVTRTNDSAADIFTEREFVRVMTTGYFYVEYERTKNTPAGWFPLPFFLPEADTF